MSALFTFSNEIGLEGIATTTALVVATATMWQTKKQRMLSNFITYSNRYNGLKERLPADFYKMPADAKLESDEYKAAKSMVSLFAEEHELYRSNYWSQRFWKRFKLGMEKYIASEKGRAVWHDIIDETHVDIDADFCQLFCGMEADVMSRRDNDIHRGVATLAEIQPSMI